MPRKLAEEALYSTEMYDRRYGRPNDMPTVEHIKKVDPDGTRALDLMKKFERKEEPNK